MSILKKWNFDKKAVAGGIAALKASNTIPHCVLQCGVAVLKRHQKALYSSAIHFSAPNDVNDCGRFNPPGGKIGVWYASDSALTAAAEAYGRVLHLNGITAYPESVLTQHYMCSVDVVRTVKVIDVVSLCEMLHIPPGYLETEDYAFPQWLMEHLYFHFAKEDDGIAYTSRHKRYKRCYAFWQGPEASSAFSDTLNGMVSYAQYREADTAMFPEWWHKSTMSGEEMFEVLLGFDITPEPF
nr:RES family NAD+ phosphorylase [uncultured Enterobacter sp.]